MVVDLQAQHIHIIVIFLFLVVFSKHFGSLLKIPFTFCFLLIWLLFTPPVFVFVCLFVLGGGELEF